jgi:hypothetical protein
MLSHILVVTTDGQRESSLKQLLNSIPDNEQILVALLEQCGSSTASGKTRRRFIRLTSSDRIPLSVARNRVLDHLNQALDQIEVGPATRLLFPDDDCWYGDEFFATNEHLAPADAILVHPTSDPVTGRAFASWNVRDLPHLSPISPQDLLYFATSIGIDLPARLGLSLRFDERIGLGCAISQGEESLFLFRALDLAPQTRVLSMNSRPVFHPRKRATDSRHHYALAYFLGWCVRGPYPFASRHFRYKWVRSLGALVLRPGGLSTRISWALLRGYLDGRADRAQLGPLNAARSTSRPRRPAGA